MAIILDSETEQLIQRELDRGRFSSSGELLQYALVLLEQEDEWLEMNKSDLNARLGQSMAQIERGEGIPGDQLLSTLAQRR